MSGFLLGDRHSSWLPYIPSKEHLNFTNKTHRNRNFHWLVQIDLELPRTTVRQRLIWT
jgi:hypothetical protein